jgi:gamma-glutamylcyclotransferase (GGCT)/AIG2-like uncharacterized protein YtfP
MQRLFVYGTLAPGRANHKKLAHVSGTWEEASIIGTLLQEGWGCEMGYPGIIPGPDGEKVDGFVFSSTELKDHWSMLDDFEGEGYKRVPVTADIIGKDEKVEAYVYALNRDA